MRLHAELQEGRGEEFPAQLCTMLCDTGPLDHGSAVGSDEEKVSRKSRMGGNYKTQSVHVHAVLQTQSFPSCFRFCSICVLQGEQKVLQFDSSARASELQIKQYCLTLVRVSSSCRSVMMTGVREQPRHQNAQKPGKASQSHSQEAWDYHEQHPGC